MEVKIKVPLDLLAKEIKEKVKFVYLFGENRFLLEKEFKAVNFSNFKMFSNLDECILDIKNNFVNYAYFLFLQQLQVLINLTTLSKEENILKILFVRY